MSSLEVIFRLDAYLDSRRVALQLDRVGHRCSFRVSRSVLVVSICGFGSRSGCPHLGRRPRSVSPPWVDPLLLTPYSLGISLARKNAVTSWPAIELAWVGVLSILWLCTSIKNYKIQTNFL